MKISVRTLLLVVTLVAVFFSGWIGGANYQRRLAAINDAKAIAERHLQSLLRSQHASKVEGIVTGTKDDLAAVSLGTDDGIRTGQVLDFYRGTKYLGRGTVIKTEHNQSAAKIDRSTSNVQLCEGDYVTAKF